MPEFPYIPDEREFPVISQEREFPLLFEGPGEVTVVGTWGIYVDWDNDGDFEDSYEDITSYVLSAMWGYGRDYQASPIGGSSAGMCWITLKNTSGIFNSYNSSSPIYGNILPGRKIKIECSYGGTQETLFVGYLRTIQPEPRIGDDGTALLEALGPISQVADKECNIPLQAAVRTGTIIGAILDDAGWGAGDRDIDTGKTEVPYFSTEGQQNVWAAIMETEEAEAGFFRENRDGDLVFEDRTRRGSATRSKTSQATFKDDSTGTLRIMRLSQRDPVERVFNQIAVTVRDLTAQSEAVLWTLQKTGENALAIKAGESIEIWSTYPNIESPSNAYAVQSWSDLVADTDYTANASATGSGADMTSDISIAQSKFDRTQKLTITNNHGSAIAYITFLQAKGVALLEADEARISYGDSASQTKYKTRRFPNPSKHLESVRDAELYCQHMISQYKDPKPILILEYAPNRSATEMAEMLAREISDRITVTANSNSQLGINRDFYIERIVHMLSEGTRNHRCAYELTPADTAIDYFTLDTSQLDGSDVLGPEGW